MDAEATVWRLYEAMNSGDGSLLDEAPYFRTLDQVGTGKLS